MFIAKDIVDYYVTIPPEVLIDAAPILFLQNFLSLHDTAFETPREKGSVVCFSNFVAQTLRKLFEGSAICIVLP